MGRASAAVAPAVMELELFPDLAGALSEPIPKSPASLSTGAIGPGGPLGDVLFVTASGWRLQASPLRSPERLRPCGHR